MSEQTLTVLLIIGGFVLSVILAVIGYFFAVWFRTSGQKATEVRGRDDRLNKIEVQLALLNFQARRRWASSDEVLIDDLHHPHPEYAEMDALLDKVENGVTIEETQRLKDLLQARINAADPKITRSEKDSARKLENVLDRVLIKSGYAEDDPPKDTEAFDS